MSFGTLCHTGRLEPMQLALRYAVMPRFEDDSANVTAKGDRPKSPRSTGYYKDKVAEFEAANRDKDIVSQAEFDRMLGLCQAVQSDPTAAAWFNSPGDTEVSLAWHDPDTGLLCKARLDKVVPGERIVDLKTTVDGGKFEKSIVHYGYHRQAAHYQLGWGVLTGERLPFCFVAVESAEPFCVRAAPLSQEAVDVGRRECEALLAGIAEAGRTGVWPGYDSPSAWVLPSWYEAGDAKVELVIGGETVLL